MVSLALAINSISKFSLSTQIRKWYQKVILTRKSVGFLFNSLNFGVSFPDSSCLGGIGWSCQLERMTTVNSEDIVFLLFKIRSQESLLTNGRDDEVLNRKKIESVFFLSQKILVTIIIIYSPTHCYGCISSIILYHSSARDTTHDSILTILFIEANKTRLC